MINEFNTYQELATTTASYKDPDYLPLGLAEECGELVHEFARDVLWLLSQICREHGLSLSDVAANNISKLTKRHLSGSIHLKENR